MKQTLLASLVSGLVVGLLFVGVLSLKGEQKLGGTTNLDSLELSGTLTSAGIVNSGTMTVGGGTAISKYSCTTASWNPGSVATSTITNSTSSDIALSGAVVTDICGASLSSATSSAIRVGCAITGAATATISITNLGTTNAAIDLATGTAEVCYWN